MLSNTRDLIKDTPIPYYLNKFNYEVLKQWGIKGMVWVVICTILLVRIFCWRFPIPILSVKSLHLNFTYLNDTHRCLSPYYTVALANRRYRRVLVPTKEQTFFNMKFSAGGCWRKQIPGWIHRLCRDWPTRQLSGDGNLAQLCHRTGYDETFY